MVTEFLQEYLETNCYTTTFARKQGINDSTFLGWGRQFDTEHIYPSGKQGRVVSNEGCTIHLGSDCSIDELSKILTAIKRVRR